MVVLVGGVVVTPGYRL